MPERSDPLWHAVRVALFATAPMNLCGALLFVPQISAGRALLGLPEGPHLYMWLISTWVLVFGLAYLRMAVLDRPDRTFMMVGAAGKTTYVLCLMGAFAAGQIPFLAAASALPDVVFAGLFTAWLVQTRAG